MKDKVLLIPFPIACFVLALVSDLEDGKKLLGH
jgi:hypothetical protein